MNQHLGLNKLTSLSNKCPSFLESFLTFWAVTICPLSGFMQYLCFGLSILLSPGWQTLLKPILECKIVPKNVSLVKRLILTVLAFSPGVTYSHLQIDKPLKIFIVELSWHQLKSFYEIRIAQVYLQPQVPRYTQIALRLFLPQCMKTLYL